MRKGKKNSFLKFLTILSAVTGLLLGSLFVYANDYYRADASIQEILEHSSIRIEKSEDKIVFLPEQAKAGLIFYPGGKVDHEAYVPLLEKCAQKGILCVLLAVPLRLAVLDPNAADGITQMYPEVSDWYLAGHSLGGVIAGSYLNKHRTEYKGLILLASYVTCDLSASDLKVLSIRGSEDGILNQKRYEQALDKFPEDSREVFIEGGCHSGFGAYGAQKGDGIPTLSSEEQMSITADAIAEFID